MANSSNMSRNTYIGDISRIVNSLKEDNLDESVIRKRMKKEFAQKTSVGVTIALYVLRISFVFMVVFGMHICYATIMWEADIYNFWDRFSPYFSMIIFFALCLVVFVIFVVFMRFFVDYFRYFKALDESFGYNFYLRLFRGLCIFALVFVGVFLMVVLFSSWHISNIYNVRFDITLINVLGEIFD